MRAKTFVGSSIARVSISPQPCSFPKDVVRALTRTDLRRFARRLASQLPCPITMTLTGEGKAMLLGGLDAIDLTLQSGETIAAWIAADRRSRPWVYLEPTA